MAKTTNRRAEPVVTTPALKKPAARTRIPRSVKVADCAIACRAFELYCGRGREHGHDAADWLEAERQLRGAASSTVA